MTNEKFQLLLIKGVIADLPPDDRKRVEAAETEMRRVIATHKEPGYLALALLGAELAANG